MAINFDLNMVNINKIRSVASGEVSGSARFLALVLCAAGAWIGGMWLSGMAGSAGSTMSVWQGRYAQMTQLAAEYETLTASGTVGGEVDVMTAFTQVSARIELGSRVSRISPMLEGRRCVVEINRMYAEEVAEMVRELAARGVKVISAEIFTIPVGEERLFRLTATIGTEA